MKPIIILTKVIPILAMVLSVLQFSASDYPFGILKLFLQSRCLV
jgi:hypothetical protein